MEEILPQATIAPVPLAGEPATDRAFLCEEDGRTYRVRTVRVAQPLPWAEGAVVPLAEAVDITVVRLGEDGSPERNAAGQVVIVGNTRWPVDQQAAGGDLAEQFQLIVRHIVHVASRTAAAPAALDALLAGWWADAPATDTNT